MIDIYTHLKQNHKTCFIGGTTMEIVEECQQKLRVKFPRSYVEFLTTFGEGGLPGMHILGIKDKNICPVVDNTKIIRNQHNAPKELVAISYYADRFVKWMECLDLSREQDGDCPIVRLNYENNKITEYKSSFVKYLYDEVNRIYAKGISRDELENKDLLKGVGYKSCWMVIENSSQLEIADILLGKEKERMKYEDGLLAINKVPYQEKKVVITADYQNQNYIIGDAVGDLFDMYEKIQGKFRGSLKMYLYLTERVSDTHGFAMFVRGNLKRMFYYGEDKLKNFGNVLPAEEKLNINLPSSFKEIYVKENQYTKIDEELIVELAREQVGMEVDDYPYEDVLVGKFIL